MLVFLISSLVGVSWRTLSTQRIQQLIVMMMFSGLRLMDASGQMLLVLKRKGDHKVYQL